MLDDIIKKIIIIFALLFSCVLTSDVEEANGSQTSENTIVIMTPYVWQCDQGSIQTVLVDLVSAQLMAENIHLNVTLKSRTDSSMALSILETVVPNDTGFHRVDIELNDKIANGYYDLDITAISDNAYEFKGSLKSLECRSSSNGLYIITDKPVYRDSEKVRFRVINIDSNLLPVDGQNASIFIIDPNQNRVQQFLNVEFSNGLVDGLGFQLTDRPIYGNWQIKVIVDDSERTVNFNVKEYVLPKFDFTVNLPEYVLNSAKQIQGNIEAKYTYGKALDGDVTVRLENQYYGFFNGTYETRQIVQYEKTYTLTKGKADFTIPFKSNNSYYSYKINVTVTDKYSNESSSKEFYLYTINTEFFANLKSYTFYANQTNDIKVNLVRQNAKPYSLKAVDVNITQRLANYMSIYDTKSLSLKTDLNGQLEFNIFAGENVSNIELVFTSVDDPSQKAYAYLYKYVDNQWTSSSESRKLVIERESAQGDLQLGTMLSLKLVRNETDAAQNCVNARYFVLGKLRVLMDSVIELCDENIVYIDLTFDYAPYSNLVAYYIDPTTKKVSVANYEINIPNFFQNQLEIKFGENSTQPGEEVEIELYTKEKSIVSLCIIDKSVELLGAGANELTVDSISAQVYANRLYGYMPPFPTLSPPLPGQFGGRGFLNRMIIRPGYWNRTQALEDLNAQGIMVTSDLDDLNATFIVLHANFKNKGFSGPYIPLNQGGQPGPMPAAIPDVNEFDQNGFGASPTTTTATGGSGSNSNKPDAIPIRTNFQETWIWNTYDVGNQTQKLIYSKIPDTITSWVASGFSLNSEYGIAIANKTQITVFKNFFVSIILPVSLIRGEILHLQVVVFNYFDHDLKNVHVTLSKTDDFKLSDGNDSLSDITNDIEQTIPLIESQSAQTVEFLISPTKLGMLPLTVRAVSDEAGDGETRSLKVKAEGIPQASTQSLLIELDQLTTFTLSHDFHVDLPANVVNGSDYCSLQVIGDLLGPSLNNLDKLINKPYGCGEQNMITLTPNIYALNYLNALAESDSKSTISNFNKFILDAKQNILFGYQNQLKYVLDDGSFSAFGQSDGNGSTWLTAFVLKSFAQARQYAPEIDDHVISKAANFLLERQSSGAFVELGRVIHRDMQGGVNSEQTITAYVVTALIESGLYETESNITESIKVALAYLESQTDKINDVYTLGLVTYALTLGQSEQAKKYFDLFQSKAIKSSDGSICWSKSSTSCDSSNDIELTSYGLLLNLNRNDISTSLSIVRYLVAKSSSLGGYSNTQSTVLALQALSEFDIKTNSGVSNGGEVTLNASLIDSNNNLVANKSYTVSSQNSLVLQTWDLDGCQDKVKLTAQGRGKALFQLVASYNIPKLPASSSLSIKQTSESTNTNSLKVKTCTTYSTSSTDAADSSTGMTLIEATLLSGFEAEKTELDGLIGQVEYLKLIEIKDQSVVVFYLDQLDNGHEFCIDWKMHKQNDVDNLQPVPVKVYDYYQSNLEYSTLFQPPTY